MEDWFARSLTFVIPLWMSLGVHEWAHAWAAHKLGDDTARLLGRMSLNPFVHLDPVGTVLLPLVGVPFGWAKPVPVEPVRFRRSVPMAWGVLLTAIAGPVSNLVLAAVAVGLLAVLHLGFADFPPYVDAFRALLLVLVPLNVLLAVFNMLPIPPLDGSRVVEGLVSPGWRPTWDRVQSCGPGLLVAVIVLPLLVGVSPLTTVYLGILDGLGDFEAWLGG